MKRFQVQAQVTTLHQGRLASLTRPTFSVEAQDAEAAFKSAIEILGIDLSDVNHIIMTALDVDASQPYSAMGVPGLWVPGRGLSPPTLSVKKL